MDSKCFVCGKEESLVDVCATSLELQCEHEVCATCVLKSNDLSDETIKCPACKAESKMLKAFRKILNDAKRKLDGAGPLLCKTHPNEVIKFIYRDTGEFLCCNCILEPPYNQKVDRLLKYDFGKTSELVKVVKRNWEA